MLFISISAEPEPTSITLQQLHKGLVNWIENNTDKALAGISIARGAFKYAESLAPQWHACGGAQDYAL